MKMWMAAAAAVLAIGSSAMAEVVEFTIVEGTGGKPWNTKETAIAAKLGDVIRFHNADTIAHILHTNGAPCAHGSTFQPGADWDCKVSKEFSAATQGPLYDHNFGPTAAVWIEIIK